MGGMGDGRRPDSFGAMTQHDHVLLLLGGNLGNPQENLGEAERMISDPKGSIRATLIARSRDHWTEPWGFLHKNLFLNRALIISTGMEPLELLGELHVIETAMGRTRSMTGGYSARTIDIDILLMGDRIMRTGALEIPHPRLHERAFALEPAADIAPGWIHPAHHRTVLELLNDLRTPA